MATIRKKSAGTYQLIVYTRYTEDGKQSAYIARGPHQRV